jgi:EipB-like
MSRKRAGSSTAIVAVLWMCLWQGDWARAEEADIILVPHRAVYEFSLSKSQAHSGILAVFGRMVYELTGSTCEGYAEKLRFVTEMTNADGEQTIADLQSSTWEEAGGKRFRFNSTDVRDGKPAEDIAGDATRTSMPGHIVVELTKPDTKDLTLPERVYFPTQHVIALLNAARMGRASFHADVYDGSERGEKVYHTISTIGALIPHDANHKLGSITNAERLRGLSAWPIRISYFDPNSDREDAGPAYEIRSVFFENGVNREAIIDYGSFAIKGELTKIDFLESKKCK